MERLQRNIGFIAAFKSTTSAKQAKALLKNITPEQSEVLGDIAANLIQRTLTLSAKGKESLGKYREFVYCIGDKGTTHKHRLRCIKKHPDQALILIEVTAEKLVRLCNVHKTHKKKKK